MKTLEFLMKFTTVPVHSFLQKQCGGIFMDMHVISDGIRGVVAKENLHNRGLRRGIQNLDKRHEASAKATQKAIDKKIALENFREKMAEFEANGSMGPIPGIPQGSIVDKTL